MIGKLLDGRYKITQILGGGGFGRTFLAEDTKFPKNPICVVKQLHPATTSKSVLLKAKELFEREAKTLGELGEHSNIPRLLAYFEEDKEFYLVEEYVVGRPLSAELFVGQPLSEEKVITILVELLIILSFVHDNNVIHRDIKPDNIIRRTLDQKLVLIDFGSVKEVTKKENSSKTLIGTPGYIPVEQAVGNPRFSSDLYAVGMICLQALTGQNPQELPRDYNTETILWHDLARVKPELATILDKMIAHDYRDRYVSAREALEDVNRLISGQPNFVPTQSSPPPTQLPSIPTELITSELNIQRPRQINKNLVIFGSVGGLAAILILGVGVYFSQMTSVPNPKLSLDGKAIEGILSENDDKFEQESIIPIENNATPQVYYYQVYHFKGRSGQKIMIEMDSKDIDPSLKLVSPNGVEVAKNDDISPDNSNAKIVEDLQDNGIYKVIVTTSQPQETGGYQLSAKEL